MRFGRRDSRPGGFQVFRLNLSSLAGNLKNVVRSVINLGLGEAASNISSFLLFAYLSRRFGVELLGIVALAQTVARYVMLGTDQGLRLVGARLVARSSAAASIVIKQVLVKRLVSCSICVALGCGYAIHGPVPESSRLYILGFVLGVVPYAFSLDWLAWGLDKFAWLGTFRGGVTALFLVISVVGIALSNRTLLPLTLGNGLAATLGAVILWFAWRFRWEREIDSRVPIDRELVHKELRWLALLPLGIATILGQVFHNFDTVLLGAMSNASEVGRYSSAYRILFFVLGAYWLVTNSLYPRLARIRGGSDTRKLFFVTVALVASVGVLVALVTRAFASDILTLAYGTDLGAAGLLRILVLAIPMDFCASLISVVLASRSLDRLVLASVGSAAVFNFVVNLWLIPAMGANGAAWATIASYVLLLTALLGFVMFKPVLSEAGTPADAYGTSM